MDRDRKEVLSFTVDPASVRTLDLLAKDFEGNRSMAVRQLIHSEAERRGLLSVSKQPAPRQEKRT
jgi:hypothetical protein